MSNKKRRGGGNNPPRYTGKNVDVMGDPGRMEKHAIDVFRDMSRGKYNFDNIFEFQNRDFVYAAIRAAEKQHRRHDIIRTALDFAYGASDDVDVISLRNIELTTCNGWLYIVNTMYRYMRTGDITSLMGMAQKLSGNRNLRL